MSTQGRDTINGKQAKLFFGLGVLSFPILSGLQFLALMSGFNPWLIFGVWMLACGLFTKSFPALVKITFAGLFTGFFLYLIALAIFLETHGLMD